MIFSLALAAVGLAARANALGSMCGGQSLGAGSAAPGAPFWYQLMPHQGYAPFSSNPASYSVYRNVKDYGAAGDGTTDDTAAINSAIEAGNRCGSGCASTSTTPAVVFFPQGTYLVSGPINAIYYTQLIGDARVPPTIRASPSFSGAAVIDADPSNYYSSTDNFFRSVRNFNIDLTQTPAASTTTGIHWRVSKGTSLVNVAFQMSSAGNTEHQGIFIEDGSGGFIGDLVFNGGKYGLNVGSQQFTARNITVNNAQTGVLLSWANGWTFQGVTLNNVQIGFDVIGATSNPANRAVGSLAIIDSYAANSQTFLRTSNYAPNTENGGSIVLNNIKVQNVNKIVADANGATYLAGGATTLPHWEQGTSYQGSSTTQTYELGVVTGPAKPAVLLGSNGWIFGKSHPQYASYAPNQFVSVRSSGAHGDGQTDDTAAIQQVFAQWAGCKIIFFDAGVYPVSSTITIPTGTQIVGEAWSVILGTTTRNNFKNPTSPQVVVQVGTPLSAGVLEISDMIFSTQGPAPGAIVVEWNAHDPAGQQGAVGAWDTHIRLGGATGTNLVASTCTPGSSNSFNCIPAFLGLHLTVASTAYLEGMWVWAADHELDESQAALNIFSGRGILSESSGPVWLIGTAAENHAFYQYNLYDATNHYLGFVQGQTPNYEAAFSGVSIPFTTNSAYHDPPSPQAAWGLYIRGSNNVIVFGAGFYSPVSEGVSQPVAVNIDSGPGASTLISIYALNTVGVNWMFQMNTSPAYATAAANQAGGQGTLASWTS